MSTATDSLLVEIGTEELPPKALKNLRDAFTQGIVDGLAENNLSHGKVSSYASPRRLALVIEALQIQGEDQSVEALGPPADRAKDEDGSWSKAAEGFARKNNIEPEQLEVIDTPKGPRLGHRSVAAGNKAQDCLESIVNNSVNLLPIPKRMRWGAGRTEFVRPAHWVVVLLGSDVVKASVLGIDAGNCSRGHRFHSSGNVVIDHADHYQQIMLDHKVVADFDDRQAMIVEQVNEQASAIDAQAVIDSALLDEVTGLVEWPVALRGGFEERFLAVPSEALVYSMKEHQKYFHLINTAGELLPNFITVSNIVSQDPAQVIDGNERVIRPRLADADFFFTSDKKSSLESRVERLKDIVFQAKLGTLHDKTIRVANLAKALAPTVGADSDLAHRAALLSKTDLITDMVGEFADMQGIAGRYYAINDGENTELADAIEQQYWPKFAGDKLPNNPVATCVALADRLDTLVGIFGIGQAPTGSRDPFALRRASLGVLRIIVEGELKLDLANCLAQATSQYAADVLAVDTATQVQSYMLDRFRAWYEDENIPVQVFMSVASRELTEPLDIHQRVHAVHAFSQLPEAAALAAANKRVANILEKQGSEIVGSGVSKDLLTEPAEKLLAEQIEGKLAHVSALLQDAQYTESLAALADLREPVDGFFDQVMVMVDDEALRDNRVQLLKSLRDLFLRVADISYLVVAK